MTNRKYKSNYQLIKPKSGVASNYIYFLETISSCALFFRYQFYSK